MARPLRPPPAGPPPPPHAPLPGSGHAPVYPSAHPSLHPCAHPHVHSMQPQAIHAALMVAAAYGWTPPAPRAPATIGPPSVASTPALRIYVLVTTTALAVISTVLFFLVATHRAEISLTRAQGAKPVAVAPLVPVTAVTAAAPPPASAPSPARSRLRSQLK